MENKKEIFFQKIISNPIFFLVAIILIFAVIFYFFGNKEESGSMNSIYDYGDSVVVIVEYGDYQCPACISSYTMIEQILKEYEGKVKLDYRHFPLPGHEFALKASIVAECAREQGKFWEMHAKLYESAGKLDENSLNEYAKELGLDEEKYSDCFNHNKYIETVNEQKRQGIKDKISGTPTFFINGKKVVNLKNSKYLPNIEDFRREIDAELEKI